MSPPMVASFGKLAARLKVREARAVLRVRVVEPQELMELRRLVHDDVVVPHGRHLVALAMLEPRPAGSDRDDIFLDERLAAVERELVRVLLDDDARGLLWRSGDE